MQFSNITATDSLISYLDSSLRLKDCQYLSHYTTYDKLVKILDGGLLYMGKAETMNDQLEFQNGSKKIWDRLYFTSLIMNHRENIGMWGVYASPWEDGVKLSISKEVFKKWITNCDELYVIDKDMKKTGERIRIDDKLKVFYSAVAYTNIDSKEIVNEQTIIQWGNQENKKILDKEIRRNELTGYVKDVAWSYEKELRIKALLSVPYNSACKLAISIEPIINDLILTTGPLFRGSLKQRLMQDCARYINTNFNFESSIFTNRFKM